MRMVRLVIFTALAVQSLAAAAAGDAPAPALSAVNGVYVLAFDASEATPMPAGARLVCKARMIPNLPNAENSNIQPAVGGGASPVGSRAKCTLEVPFSWVVIHPQNGASLSYEIEAVSAAGTRIWAIAQRGIGVAYPRAGTTAQMSFTLRF
jgi:hypothetical protein